MGKVIELKQINKCYGEGEHQTQVLFDINLDFETQTFNTVIGQSGSGKSTLLNIMSSLDKPSSGEVWLDGCRVDQLSKNALAERRNQLIGFIFQFHYLLPEFTALENVLMPYRVSGKKVTNEVKEWANHLMDFVGLSKVKHNLSVNMSGGQQQRTAIARALINKPKIVFADEPTGNLDSETSEQVYKLLKDINQEYGTTFVMITHDRKIAEKSDRIIELKDGKVDTDVKK